MCWLDADLVQLLSAEMKEFSDGEMTVALASVTTDKEVKHCSVLQKYCQTFYLPVLSSIHISAIQVE